jgi:hypothetical protein
VNDPEISGEYGGLKSISRNIVLVSVESGLGGSEWSGPGTFVDPLSGGGGE